MHGTLSDSTVSVIVPTFNRAGYIEQCLDSLLAQTVQALEILVIDDGSEDDTPARVAHYEAPVRYFRKANSGKPSAVNFGLSHARGSWIWIFDDDDVALPDAIERRLEALARKADADFVYGPHCLGSDGPDGQIVIGRQTQPPVPTDDQFFLAIMKSCFFHLGTVLVRRRIFNELAGFDPRLLRGQDYEFQIRLARIARPAYCATPTFIFRQHTGVRGTSVNRHTAGERGAIFQQYSQAVGLKLRGSVSLGEYLTPPVSRNLEATTERQALLNRVHVMANHGCIPELLDDLQALLQLAARGQPLSPVELRAITLAMHAGWACEASALTWPHFFARVRSFRRCNSGKAVVRALAAGFFGVAKGYPDSMLRRIAKLRQAARLTIESYR